MPQELNQNLNLFQPTTDIWDTSEIYAIDIPNEQFRELLVRLYQNLNRMALVLNSRDSGVYQNNSMHVTGQTWFPNPIYATQLQRAQTTPKPRPNFRVVVNFGALPNTALKSVAHGIICNGSTTITRLYGAASDTTDLLYIPIPYASPTLANNIELSMDATNVNITTGSNRSNFNITYVVIEYLQT
jgi:hypothetical protein